jgi:ubiquinone biosynthesis protein COQ4
MHVTLPSLPSLSSTVTALRAVRALLADPDDTPTYFALADAVDSFKHLERRLAASKTGRVLLEERPDIVPLLADREALRRLPAGSLGRAYLAFVESANISAAGLEEAAGQGCTKRTDRSPSEQYVLQRIRGTHDLWHTVAGYGADVLGEVAMQAFSFAQTLNISFGFVTVTALFKTIGAPELRGAVVEAFRRGHGAEWLPEQHWETMLVRPLSEVRARLGIEAPRAYAPTQSANLRAMLA